MRNRGIGRARMFMGALLLLAAVLTWSIGLMMSPHGDSGASGTEYLKSAVVTFKRKGAVGTLILCALTAWLLFPARRPRWPTRDWALGLLLGFLGVSSIYTLVSLRQPPTTSTGLDQNLVGADTNVEGAASEPPYQIPPDLNVPQTYSTGPVEVPPSPVVTGPRGDEQLELKGRGARAEPTLPQEPIESNQSIGAQNQGDEAPGEARDETGR